MRELVQLPEILNTKSFSDAASTYRCMPGVVMAFYPGAPGIPASVDVQPGVSDPRMDTETNTVIFEDWPQIPKVPIAYPRFGPFAVWGPLQVGAAVLLVSFDLDPGPFLATGLPAKPANLRRNSGVHWWALPADLTDSAALPDSAGALCLGTPGGVMVSVSAAGVNLGSLTPTDAVALATKVAAELTKIAAALAGLSCAAAPGPVVSSAPYTTPGAVASATVKCTP